MPIGKEKMENKQVSMEKSESGLMSPMAIFLLGVNSIIGSGVFVFAGKIYNYSGIYSLLALLLAGIAILFIALSYGNMAKIYPQNGGAFIYAKESFGRYVGFLIGMDTWMITTVLMATEVAALITALKMIFPALPYTISGLFILIILGIASLFGPGLLSKLSSATSFIKILTITIFVLFSVWSVKWGNFVAHIPHITTTANLHNFLLCFGMVFYFYTGFQNLPINIQKMKNPTKVLPKMMTLVVITSAAIYILLQGITIGSLGVDLPKTAVPAAEAFSRVVGPLGAGFIVGAICLSIFGVTVTFSFNSPTVLASLANERIGVPRNWAENNKYGAPMIPIAITFVVAIILFLSGSFVFLAGLVVFLSFIQYLSTGLTNIKHKFYVIGVLSVLFSLVLLTSFTLPVLFTGVGTLALLSIIYMFVKNTV